MGSGSESHSKKNGESSTALSRWDKVKNTLMRTNSSQGRRSRTNSIRERERTPNTDSSITRESGASLTSSSQTDKGDKNGKISPTITLNCNIYPNFDFSGARFVLASLCELVQWAVPCAACLTRNDSQVSGLEALPIPGHSEAPRAAQQSSRPCCQCVIP